MRAPDEPFQDVCPPSVDTLIFVDVDGVLNVCASDADGGALLLSDANAALALKSVRRGRPHCGQGEAAEKVLSVWQRRLPQGGGETYASLACQAPATTSAVLTARLARLIKIAGGSRAVVLSSSWRRPSHAARVRRLEELISEQSGEPFTFDAATALRKEVCAGDRLHSIADFVAAHCRRRVVATGSSTAHGLLVLVLEDFFVSATGGWQCDGRQIDSIAAAEQYLRSRAAGRLDISAKVIHTYDDWVTPASVAVSVGSGLTMSHFKGAAAYLRGHRSPCRRQRNGGTSVESVSASWEGHPGKENFQPQRHRAGALATGLLKCKPAAAAGDAATETPGAAETKECADAERSQPWHPTCGEWVSPGSPPRGARCSVH